MLTCDQRISDYTLWINAVGGISLLPAPGSPGTAPFSVGSLVSDSYPSTFFIAFATDFQLQCLANVGPLSALFRQWRPETITWEFQSLQNATSTGLDGTIPLAEVLIASDPTQVTAVASPGTMTQYTDTRRQVLQPNRNLTFRVPLTPIITATDGSAQPSRFDDMWYPTNSTKTDFGGAVWVIRNLVALAGVDGPAVRISATVRCRFRVLF